jgi:hypothetical protein
VVGDGSYVVVVVVSSAAVVDGDGSSSLLPMIPASTKTPTATAAAIPSGFFHAGLAGIAAGGTGRTGAKRSVGGSAAGDVGARKAVLTSRGRRSVTWRPRSPPVTVASQPTRPPCSTSGA